MTAALMWPEWVLTPRSISPLHALAMNTSGGRSPTGSEQVVGNSPGRWRIVLGGVAVNTEEQERVWRTIALNLGGRAGAIMVPALSRRTAPWPTMGGNLHFANNKTTLTDDILFSDGWELFPRTIVAQSVAAVAAGAVSMQIRLLAGSSLKVGQIFQAGECVYTISKIPSVDDFGTYPVFTVNFRLPCRVAIAADAALEFDNPRFRARLEADDGMALDLEMWRHGSPSVAFVEDN